MLHCALLRLSRSNKEKEMLTQTHETHWKAMAHAMASLKRKRLVRVWRLPFNLANPNPRAPAAQEQSKANACSAPLDPAGSLQYMYMCHTLARAT